jgi:hypothetical protein
MIQFLRGLVHINYQDSRANRLDAVEIRSTGQVLECVCRGPSVAASQIGVALQGFGAVALDHADGLGSTWTHAWSLERAPTAEIVDRLASMKDVLYLRVRPPVELAIALGWYTRVAEDDAGFEHTAVGSTLRAAKYHSVTEAFTDLVQDLSGVLKQHPAFMPVTNLISVPGSSPASRFSVLLAHAVGDMTGLPVVDAMRIGQSTPRKGSTDDDASDDLAESFQIDVPLEQATVCIVDDVFRKGVTMRGVAHAAVAAGAGHSLGLVAARTLSGVG